MMGIRRSSLPRATSRRRWRRSRWINESQRRFLFEEVLSSAELRSITKTHLEVGPAPRNDGDRGREKRGCSKTERSPPTINVLVDRPTTRAGSISVSACNLPRRMLMDFGDLSSPPSLLLPFRSFPFLVLLSEKLLRISIQLDASLRLEDQSSEKPTTEPEKVW